MQMAPGLPLKCVIIISLAFGFLGLRVSAGFSAASVTNPPLQTNTSDQAVNGQPAHEIAQAPIQESKLAGQKTQSTVCNVSEGYPQNIRQWCAFITSYAAKYQQDADLLAALIWQESGGDPLAYSQSGAVGLMQVMPRDGLAAGFQCVNGPCFRNRPTIQELQNPEFNIDYGTAMLAGLFQKHGSLREALLFYGPSGVGYYYADKVLGIYENYKK
jgi:soluble lytic murein transglycosylase-like protein